MGEIREMLSFEYQRQMLGCQADEACLAEIGGALGTDELVHSSIIIEGTNTSFTFTLPASATIFAPATWSVRWTATDAAGNTHASSQQISTVDVDGSPPPTPLTGAAAAPELTWARTPWGTAASTTPVFQLSATLASVGSDATTVIAWDGPDAGAREVGRASPAGGPPFVLPLTSDPAELHVSSLDRAGNVSARTRVVDVVWTATGDRSASADADRLRNLDACTRVQYTILPCR